MLPRRTHRALRSLPRALIAWAGLIAFVIASFGVLPPIDRLFTALAPRERYPCESCACGCASAHECWTACCCHSPAERLAWAIRNSVTPPPDVRFSDSDVAMAHALIAADQQSCPMCHADAPPADEQSADAAHPPAPRFPGSMSALNCKGKSPWLALPAPVCTRAALVTPMPLPGTHVGATITSEHADSRPIDTPVPPPRAPRSV